ncbi:hypothetical protein C0J52_12519 [Blattella germanica]|nr:hypothetical protein C0J52_12519 [Blattella germanica]
MLSNLKKLMFDLLTSPHVKEGLVPVIVEILVSVDPNVSSRLQFLAETVSEVHEPMTQVSVEPSAEEVRRKQVMEAKIKVQLNEIREEQETAVREQDFLRAQTLVEKLRELQEQFQKLSAESEIVHKEIRTECNDRATLAKCLTIIYEMMQSPTVTKLTPQLRSLMENFVMQLIEDCDTYIRSLALRAISVFCLLDQELAKQYILMFFFQLANNETNDEVCLIALRAIFDMFHLYGLQPFQMEDEEPNKEADKTGKKKLFDATGLDDEDDPDTENSQSAAMNGNSNNFISILTSLLDSMSADMRTIAAEGLCRLLLASRIKSPTLVSRLLIMWYNPITEGDIYLRQMLAAFFTTFASSHSWAQESLEQAFLPTLRTLFDAPHTSPLVEIDQDGVVRLLLNLTRPGFNPKAAQYNVHNNLAIALCNEVLVDENPYNVQVLLRALTQLDLVLDDAINIQSLSTLAEKVAETLKDRASLRHIHKFQQMLIGAERTQTTNRTETNTEASTNTDQQLDDREELLGLDGVLWASPEAHSNCH